MKINDDLFIIPRLMYPDCLDNLTTLSFPSRLVTIAEDVRVF